MDASSQRTPAITSGEEKTMSEPNDPASVPLVPAAMLHALTVAHAKIARLRLTDAEREALEFAAAHGETVDAAWRYALRGLLERMK